MGGVPAPRASQLITPRPPAPTPLLEPTSLLPGFTWQLGLALHVSPKTLPHPGASTVLTRSQLSVSLHRINESNIEKVDSTKSTIGLFLGPALKF